jgi:hypothetical protein
VGTVVCAAPATARAQYVAPPPPPPSYVASYSPVYYNGLAHYYWHDHWYYRDRYGAWQYYENEPVYFREYHTTWSGRRYWWHRR